MENYQQLKRFDILENTERKIYVLDRGFVELLEVNPRLVSEGRTIEDAIVRAARVSYNKELGTPEAD